MRFLWALILATVCATAGAQAHFDLNSYPPQGASNHVVMGFKTSYKILGVRAEMLVDESEYDIGLQPARSSEGSSFYAGDFGMGANPYPDRNRSVTIVYLAHLQGQDSNGNPTDLGESVVNSASLPQFHYVLPAIGITSIASNIAPSGGQLKFRISATCSGDLLFYNPMAGVVPTYIAPIDSVKVGIDSSEDPNRNVGSDQALGAPVWIGSDHNIGHRYCDIAFNIGAQHGLGTAPIYVHVTIQPFPWDHPIVRTVKVGTQRSWVLPKVTVTPPSRTTYGPEDAQSDEYTITATQGGDILPVWNGAHTNLTLREYDPLGREVGTAYDHIVYVSSTPILATFTGHLTFDRFSGEDGGTSLDPLVLTPVVDQGIGLNYELVGTGTQRYHDNSGWRMPALGPCVTVLPAIQQLPSTLVTHAPSSVSLSANDSGLMGTFGLRLPETSASPFHLSRVGGAFEYRNPGESIYRLSGVALNPGTIQNGTRLWSNTLQIGGSVISRYPLLDYFDAAGGPQVFTPTGTAFIGRHADTYDRFSPGGDESLLRADDPLWAAASWSQGGTFGGRGDEVCAFAMLLRSSGILTLPDGTSIDPPVLDAFLSAHSLYVDGGAVDYGSAVATIAPGRIWEPISLPVSGLVATKEGVMEDHLLNRHPILVGTGLRAWPGVVGQQATRYAVVWGIQNGAWRGAGARNTDDALATSDLIPLGVIR